MFEFKKLLKYIYIFKTIPYITQIFFFWKMAFIFLWSPCSLFVYQFKVCFFGSVLKIYRKYLCCQGTGKKIIILILKNNNKTRMFFSINILNFKKKIFARKKLFTLRKIMSKFLRSVKRNISSKIVCWADVCSRIVNPGV